MKSRIHLTLAFTLLLATCHPSTASERKNVLFIVADDLNCSLSAYGDLTAITPNIDRLAKRGLVFERAYCQQAVCNPSRSSFLTGRLPDATGVDDLRKSFRTALPDVVTLPQMFLNAGYFTQCVGKIFHNMGDTKDRKSWSVDEYLFEGTHAADTVFAQMPKPDPAPRYKAPVTEAHAVPETVYRDGRITERATEAIRRMSEKNQAFFLAVGYWRPHLPFVAPKEYWDLYDPDSIPRPNPQKSPTNAPSIALHPNAEVHGYGHVPKGPLSAELAKHLRHGYYASISFLDAQIGQLLDALETADQLDNTIVVFTSDHGFHLGEHGLWAKTSNFELDARVPLIIADPAEKQSHGKTTQALAELLDLIPTLAGLTGVACPPQQDGTSLVPVLTNARASVRSYARTQHQHPFYGRTKATHWGYSLRTDRWRYTEWQNIATGQVDDRELYDHAGDPMETVNVAIGNQDVIGALGSTLHQAFKQNGKGVLPQRRRDAEILRQ
jgi:iduronate 2-sulfatase